MGHIRFDLFHDSRKILDMISYKFGSFDKYILSSFGKNLSLEKIKMRVQIYLEERKLSNIISISYVKNLSCRYQITLTYVVITLNYSSAKLSSMGYSRSYNKPEFRKYTLFISIRKDNIFLREYGIQCLLDHEIGTHFVSTTLILLHTFIIIPP